MSGHKEYDTPLLKKIGIKKDQKILLVNAPSFILDTLKNDSILFDLDSKSSKDYQVIWIFVNTIQSMELRLTTLKDKIISNGMIWVSWFKKSSGMKSELNENMIRDSALALGLVDVKVASIDQDWSALKLVIPLNKR
ncbi:MAG: DUF3052 family protein [Saprospiraceae bacterium]